MDTWKLMKYNHKQKEHGKQTAQAAHVIQCVADKSIHWGNSFRWITFIMNSFLTPLSLSILWGQMGTMTHGKGKSIHIDWHDSR